MAQIDIYARKSKVLAAGDRLREVSTDEQVKQGRAWADRNGHTVRHVWTELGSAYSEKARPQFAGAVDAVVTGETGILWCYMLDRFTRRGAEDVLRVIGKGRVVFDYDGLDSSDERDRERIIVEAERARAYSVRLSRRVRDVKASQRDAGEWLGGAVPWGLTVDPRTRKLCPDNTPAGGRSKRARAQVARGWVTSLRAGVSARQIAREMNEEGIPAPRGDHWHGVTVLAVVRAPAFAGLQPTLTATRNRSVPYRDASGNTVRVGKGLITPEDQAALITALASVAPPPGDAKGRTKHLLTGITWCAGCSRSASCTSVSYRCAGKAADRVCENPARAGKQQLEAYVVAKWLHVVASLEPTDTLTHVIAQRWAALQAPKQTAEHREALAALKAAETVRTRLNNAFAAGAYDDAMELFTEAMKAATADVRAAQETVTRHAPPSPDMGFVDDPGLLREAWEAAPLPLRRDLLRLAIDRIEVTRADHRGQRFNGDARVTITWADVHAT